MSPEQAKGEKLDGRSDVYALGCVMYAMLEGDAPFRGKKALDVAMMHINNPFPAIQEKVPLALREIIMKCVEKKASSRYCDVNDLAAALEAFLDPIECRRREAGDAWTVRRSTPPEASTIAQFGSSVQSDPGVATPAQSNSMAGVRRTADVSLGRMRTASSQRGILRVSSSQLVAERVVRKPLTSQCIRLKTNTPTLQSRSRLGASGEQPKKEGFFKRCLERIL